MRTYKLMSQYISSFFAFGAATAKLWRRPLVFWMSLSLLANFALLAGHAHVWAPPVSAAMPAQKISARVIYCHDGDTCTLKPDDGHQPQFKLRLSGIDAPEVSWHGKKGQVFGDEAKQRVEQLVLGRELVVTVVGHDRYGRYLGRIEANGSEVNRELVAEGFAFAYRPSDRDERENASYIVAEENARAARRGMWARADRPVAPWLHRHASEATTRN